MQAFFLIFFKNFKKAVFSLILAQVYLEITRLDNSSGTKNLADHPCDQKRKYKADQNHANPLKRSCLVSFRHLCPSGNNPDWSYQSGSTHSGRNCRSVVSHMEHSGGNRPCNRRSDHRWQPQDRFLHKIRNLEHGSSKSLCHKSANSIIRKA